MNRLFDRIVADGLLSYEGGEQPTVVLMDAIAAYFYDVLIGTDDPSRGISITKELPCVAPQWPDAFFEFVDPVTNVKAGVRLVAAQGSDGWFVTGEAFVLRAGSAYKLPGTTTFFVDKDGRFIEQSPSGRPDMNVLTQGDKTGYPGKTVISPEDMAFLRSVGVPATHAANQLHSFVIAAMFAVSLLHCKNAELTEEPTPNPGMAVFGSSKAKRRPVRRFHTFHTLRVKVIEETLDYLNSTGGASSVKALHAVRGHYKEYTEDAPRFGNAKHGVGRFYCRPHLRGDKTLGFTDKQYEVA